MFSYLLICNYSCLPHCHKFVTTSVWCINCEAVFVCWCWVWCVVVSGGRGALTAVECITSGCHCTGRCTATSHRHHPEEELLSSRRSSRHFEPPDTGPPRCTTAASLQHLGQGLQSGVQWNTAARHFILLFQNASKDFGVLESFEQSQDWRGEQEEGLQDWG